MSVTPNEVIVWHQSQADHYSEIGSGKNALTLHHTGCASAVEALQARCAALEEALGDAAAHIQAALQQWRADREICLSDLEEALYDARGVIRATPDAPAEGASSEV